MDLRRPKDRQYNTKNIMRSGFKWYGIDDLISNSRLFKHSLYVCRKCSKMRYLTDGYIEVIYDSDSKVAITILSFKDKFLPINQFIKPERLVQRVA